LVGVTLACLYFRLRKSLSKSSLSFTLIIFSKVNCAIHLSLKMSCSH
jgi:hypothetical protein